MPCQLGSNTLSGKFSPLSGKTKWKTNEWFCRYNPVIKFGPSDCISRVIGIIDKTDEVISSGNKQAIHDLKDVFGLADLKDIRDFAQAISYPRKFIFSALHMHPHSLTS